MLASDGLFSLVYASNTGFTFPCKKASIDASFAKYPLLSTTIMSLGLIRRNDKSYIITISSSSDTQWSIDVCLWEYLSALRTHMRDLRVNKRGTINPFLFCYVQSFEVATNEDETTESENDDDTTTPRSKGKGKGRWKGKGKEKGTGGGGASAKHVGARVRVLFTSPYDDYFNGTVGRW